MAATSWSDCHVYRVVASIAAKSVAVISSQRINFAHSSFSSWNAQRPVFLAVVRWGFKKYQISLKLVPVHCLYLPLEGSYLASVSVAHANCCGKIIFLLENCSHFIEFRDSLPTCFQAAWTRNSHTLTLGLHEILHCLQNKDTVIVWVKLRELYSQWFCV